MDNYLGKQKGISLRNNKSDKISGFFFIFRNVGALRHVTEVGLRSQGAGL